MAIVDTHISEFAAMGTSFVLELDGRPVLAFAAETARKALALCEPAWLQAELSHYRSSGRPLWEATSEASIRPATAAEHDELQAARVREIAGHEFDGVVFAFLVPLDPELI